MLPATWERDWQAHFLRLTTLLKDDFPLLERTVSAVFDAGTTQIRRAIGHPAAPVTTEALIGVIKARLAAVTALTTGQVTDEALTRARDAHLFAYAEYIARYPVLATAAPSNAPQLYAPVTAEDTLSNCCGHLLPAIGMELSYSEQAEQIRRAQTGMQRPGPAAFGLTETAAQSPRQPPAG